MSGEVKLMPCPFCGKHGVGPAFVCESGQWDIWQVECGTCDISIETPHGLTGDAAKQAAVDRWNTRPTVVTDEVVERVKNAIAAIRSPYDHHRQTGEDCAFGDALEAAEQAVLATLAAMAPE
jgi:Lar family restriction alleviation protein